MLKPENPLIVQSDKTLLLDVHAPLAEQCRNALIPFAELIRSPEHLHTYQVTSLSLWNAASVGFTVDDAVAVLKEYARYDVPESVIVWIQETGGRFGKLRLVPAPSKINEGIKEEYLYLVSNNAYVYREIASNPAAKKQLVPCEYTAPENSEVEVSEVEKNFCFMLPLTDRGTVKQTLLNINWPVKDDVPLVDGEPLDVSLRETTEGGKAFTIREYQKGAAAALIGDRKPGTGFGTSASCKIICVEM